MSDISILSAGRLYCDLVFAGTPRMPTLGTETFAEGLSLHAGGGAFITAATTKTLGLKSALLSTLPAAPFDQIVAKDIEARGVDTTHCASAEPGQMPQITVVMAMAGDRSFLSHKSGAALPETSLEGLGFNHLHIGELRSLVEQPWLVNAARKAGMSISLDCGWDDELLGAPGDPASLIAQVDLFLPNEREMARLTAMGLPPDPAPLTVVKCGARGATALSPEGRVTVGTTRLDAFDATGAGDAFNGGFLSAWLTGTPLAGCLSIANRCGGAVISSAGGTGGLSALRHLAVPGAAE